MKAEQLLAKVPNTPEGRRFMKQLNQYLNKDTFKVYRKARHSERKLLQRSLGIPNIISQGTPAYPYIVRNGFVPAANAEYFSVFINRKRALP